MDDKNYNVLPRGAHWEQPGYSDVVPRLALFLRYNTYCGLSSFIYPYCT